MSNAVKKGVRVAILLHENNKLLGCFIAPSWPTLQLAHHLSIFLKLQNKYKGISFVVSFYFLIIGRK